MRRKKLALRRANRGNQNVDNARVGDGPIGENVGEAPVSEEAGVTDGPTGENVGEAPVENAPVADGEEALSGDDCEVVGDDDADEIVDDVVDEAEDDDIVEEEGFQDGNTNETTEAVSDSESGDEHAWNDDVIPDPLVVENEEEDERRQQNAKPDELLALGKTFGCANDVKLAILLYSLVSTKLRRNEGQIDEIEKK